MSRKLTNEIIDERLLGRKIIRIGDYKTALTKISWKCLKDGYVWNATPHDINSGYGCPACANKIPITNETIDIKLQNRSIVRIGDCIGQNNKILFCCQICDYQWVTTPKSILHGNGCPECSGKVPLTNERIDNKLSNRPIKRIGNCTEGNKINIEWQCLIETCGSIWKASPGSVLNNFRGCPHCRYKNEKRIYDYLREQYSQLNITPQYRIHINNKLFVIDFNLNDIFIEYHGIQHYEPVEYFGGKKSFIKQIKRDYLLREYCSENKIKLIEIPHWFTNDEQYELLQFSLKTST